VNEIVKLTCHACDETFSAETEEDLADLATEHAAAKHGHRPDQAHVLARIRHANRS
jgi:Protein of unknown function (DUF1059)